MGTARALMGYGIWYFLISGTRTLTGQAVPLLIGARLGVGLVTPYSIASRLVGYAGGVVVAGSGVLTPVATTLHAEGSVDRQRQLFVEGGKYCLALSLYVTTVFVLLGRGLIVAWLGPGMASAVGLLAIIAVGEALPMSQWITHGVILGMGRHKPLAAANLVETALAVPLAAALCGRYGLAGVCVAFAVPATLCRGLFQLVYGCRLVGVSPTAYLRGAVVPALAAASVPAGMLWAALAWSPPSTTSGSLFFGTCYSLIYGLCSVASLVGFKSAVGLVTRFRLRSIDGRVHRVGGGTVEAIPEDAVEALSDSPEPVVFGAHPEG